MIVNIHEAKTHLSRLVQRAASGEDIVIGKAGVPIARLVAYQETREPRTPGVWKGKVRIAADFDELPDEVAAAFRGERA
ncbi:MAG: type II toxin-antitoxin system Phd/YefM family antitoxin [Acidimicrobiales bacterium]